MAAGEFGWLAAWALCSAADCDEAFCELAPDGVVNARQPTP